ncbi:hypothetical protein [Chengkuizengella axinellae]|uniref:Uncharacterized protein n=1 Tax=Chengkuizengella axinellae TaxID=3064388 RepID=A0ABT9J0Z2_9BACL|nr:hypothetical protein [Chengkuizengella sp. 2205SS18-9]MDP5275087.1 hypothetical protein [Chengkuizengella sp. 2205SS18-9]
MKKRFTSLAVLILCFTLAIPVNANESDLEVDLANIEFLENLIAPEIEVDPEGLAIIEFLENLVAPTIKVNDDIANLPIDFNNLVAPNEDGDSDQGQLGGKG